MSELIGVAIVVAIIGFILWLVGILIAMFLFAIIVIPFYVVLGVYAVVKFIALNTFVALDELFYLGFGMPVFVVWTLWGLVIGAAIQGYREMKIYGRKRIAVVIAITPILLLVLVSGLRIANERPIDTANERPIDTEADAKPEPSGPVIPEGMVLIPAGEFQMGSNTGNPNEKPEHTVYVDAFYMDKYEVTNADYAAFLNAKGLRGSYLRNLESRPIKYFNQKFQVRRGYENYPISGITWEGAMAYAAWVEKRLPTEAEWEKAARGGLVGKEYPWGNTVDTDKANHIDYIEYFGKTTTVGSYPPNGYGLYDMAGNVLEWCLDEYDSEFYANSPQKNPISGGTITSIINDTANVREGRVLRGLSMRCASRYYKHRGFLYSGFRCVKPVSLSDSD